MPEFALELLEQVDDLGLDGDVERGDRLVGDDQLRVQRQRAGHADALALAAGELVREAVVVLGVEARRSRAARGRAALSAGRLDAVDLASARRRSCRPSAGG